MIRLLHGHTCISNEVKQEADQRNTQTKTELAIDIPQCTGISEFTICDLDKFSAEGHALWLVNEEASTLTHYLINPQSGALQEKATVSTLPAGYKGTSFAAGLVIDKAGKNLYVANRLHDSIAHFEVNANGTLTHKDDVWTRGDYPRTLTLSPDGSMIYVMNQRSDNITSFKVDKASGAINFTGNYVAVGAPSQMVIVP